MKFEDFNLMSFVAIFIESCEFFFEIYAHVLSDVSTSTLFVCTVIAITQRCTLRLLILSEWVKNCRQDLSKVSWEIHKHKFPMWQAASRRCVWDIIKAIRTTQDNEIALKFVLLTKLKVQDQNDLNFEVILILNLNFIQKWTNSKPIKFLSLIQVNVLWLS